MAVSEYDDAPRYAGSIGNGEIDTEYTPHPERILSAADQQYATRAEVAALAARLAHVERLLHRAVNAGCVDDYGEEVVSVSGTGMGIYATRRATPPLAAAERTELEQLRAKWASVPWRAIAEMFSDRWGEEDGDVPEFVTAVETWLDTMYPYERAE